MEKAVRFVNLINNLDRSREVRQFDNKSEKEAEGLALAILDMEEAFRAIIANIPKLESPSVTEEEINEVLHDIEGDLKHIVYHLYDAKTFRYLVTDVEDYYS